MNQKTATLRLILVADSGYRSEERGIRISPETWGAINYLLTADPEPSVSLIAAAPDLLKACQQIVAAFDELPPSSAARNEPLQVNAARLAIAKAMGEQVKCDE